jgi:hypothetical protein
MQVQFNHPVTFGEETYGKGQHSVPDALADDWYFKAMQEDGNAVVLREAEEAEAEAEAKPAAKKGK